LRSELSAGPFVDLRRLFRRRDSHRQAAGRQTSAPDAYYLEFWERFQPGGSV
jgi:hypothetical protein